MSRIYNFNPGPAVLPQPVLEQVQAELIEYQGRGMSILEMSHRSAEYEAINSSAEQQIKRLLDLDDDYRVLFMQGGASTQFALLPLNFLPAGRTADYVLTGSWSEKALSEAGQVGATHVAATAAEGGYTRIPAASELQLSPNPAYLHITSNNTIVGTQWHAVPAVGDVPLVADMSSDILARPFDARAFALVYAGAQKNIGPAGVTVVVVRESWLAAASTGIPAIFRYATYAKNNSLYNTPPVFAVYMLNLVLDWITAQGGLTAMASLNEAKAATVYAAIDRAGGFYRGHAEPASRSLMNVTFRLPTPELEKQFVSEAKSAGMVGLAGHRSVGGIRASLYNALSQEACTVLAGFMDEFVRKYG